MAARRSAIMTGAREMLAEKNLADISLRELSHRVGLAKSNVLRYFDSREAIFLEVFDEEFQAWLADLDGRLGKPRPRKAGYATEVRLATTMAASLVDAELLLRAARLDGRVLERNISGEFAHDFKARAMANVAAVCATRRSPTAVAAARIHGVLRRRGADADRRHVSVLRAHRGRPRRDRRDGFPEPRQRFSDGLRAGLVTWLIGAAAQAEA